MYIIYAILVPSLVTPTLLTSLSPSWLSGSPTQEELKEEVVDGWILSSAPEPPVATPVDPWVVDFFVPTNILTIWGEAP